jgi:azurin
MMPSDEKRGIVGGVSGVLSEQYHGSADDKVMAHAHNQIGEGEGDEEEVQMTAEEIKAEEDFVVRYR